MSESHPPRPWWRRAGYAVLRIWSRQLIVAWFGFRIEGGRYLADRRGALVCSNHQSHFDPVIVGLTTMRRLNYVARDSLFRFAPFRWLIQYLDAIPIAREGMGIGGIKETLRRLHRHEMVLIFPEGTRTTDGHIGRLRPGFYAIARRSGRPLVPVAIEGAYAAWPKGRSLPGLSRITVCVAPAIEPETIAALDEPGLLRLLEERLRTAHARARFLAGQRGVANPPTDTIAPDPGGNPAATG